MNKPSCKIAHIIFKQSMSSTLRQNTVALFVFLFSALVLVSAYLGWSATSTVNSIYSDATVYLQYSGSAIPSNPVNDKSPLNFLRNMTIYIGLIGALSAIVIGYQLISVDRKNGVLPLIGTRIGNARSYLIGKLAALAVTLSCITLISAFIAVITLLLLPSVSITASQWIQLSAFLFLGVAYMFFFGVLAIASTALAKTESVALLVPVTIWLTLTFIFPSLTSNIHPTAAINPIASLAPAPDSAFFSFFSVVLAPFSFAENFKILSAYFLDYLPQRVQFPIFELIAFLGNVLFATVLAIISLLKLKQEKGEFYV